MDKETPLVLIADDEKEFREAFIQKHGGNGIAIEQLNDVCDLQQNLATRKHLPDLVVIDLYRTKAEPNTPESDADNQSVNESLAKVESATAALRKIVESVKIPMAIRVLREIRSVPRLQELPVLIYTRQGLSLLSDEELREAIQLKAEWMLKGRSGTLEREQMLTFLRRTQAKNKRIKRDLILTVLGTISGFVLSIFWEWLKIKFT